MVSCISEMSVGIEATTMLMFMRSEVTEGE